MRDKKKIAILFASSIYNQKGLFNAVHNRARYLKRIAPYDIDIYLLSTYKGRLVSLLKGRKPMSRPDTFEKEGILYHILWRKNSIVDYVLYHKLHKNEIFHAIYDKQIAALFKDYDLLDVHSGAGNVALQVKKQYGIPYVITWHGSDIHTSPFNSLSQLSITKSLLEIASCNFFVSKGLVETAHKISQMFKYEILYNGANETFFKYSEEKRSELRKKYGVDSCKVVAFVGNIIDVKNPLILPEVFSQVRKKFNERLLFWVIGDGVLKGKLERKLQDYHLDYVLWGNQPIEHIPKLLQCVDVVVLPSRQEGFGMVLVEAIKCGANAVASKVGGTVEVIGADDTFALDKDFSDRLSSRIVYYLENNVKQSLDNRFSWEETAARENDVIMNLLND